MSIRNLCAPRISGWGGAGGRKFGSSKFLAKEDQSDVSLLSHWAKLEPISTSLQRGIHFFRHPTPAHPSDELLIGFYDIRINDCLPCGHPTLQEGNIRAYHVSHKYQSSLGSVSTPAVQSRHGVTMGELEAPIPDRFPFGSSLPASFGLFS